MKPAVYKTRKGAEAYRARLEVRWPHRQFKVTEDMDLRTWDTVYNVRVNSRGRVLPEEWVLVGRLR